MQPLKEIMTNLTLTDLLEEANEKEINVTVKNLFGEGWFLRIYWKNENRMISEDHPTLGELTFALRTYLLRY